MQHELDTEKLLEEWGLWSRGAGVSLRYKSPMAVVMQLVEPPDNQITPQITPEQIKMVEEGLSALKKRNALMWLVVRLTYIDSLGRKQISMRTKLAEHHVRLLLSDSRTWLDSYFFNYLRVA